MITVLQIALLLILIALIGIIIGYLFGKLSCKKQTNEYYFQKNDFCETEFPVANGLLNEIEDTKESLIVDNKETIIPSRVTEPKTLMKIENKEEPKIGLDTIEDKKIERSSKELESISMDELKNKPTVLSEPRGGKADNLCRIKGIGFTIEEKLHNLGIYHFDQIAAWTEEEIKWVDKHLAFSGRILREDWIGQAKILAAGEETEFSKRVDKGEVSTSRKTKKSEK